MLRTPVGAGTFMATSCCYLQTSDVRPERKLSPQLKETRNNPGSGNNLTTSSDSSSGSGIIDIENNNSTLPLDSSSSKTKEAKTTPADEHNNRISSFVAEALAETKEVEAIEEKEYAKESERERDLENFLDNLEFFEDIEDYSQEDSEEEEDMSHHPMKRSRHFTIYITKHGLGHATRCVSVCHTLLARGHDVTIVSGQGAHFLFSPPSTKSITDLADTTIQKSQQNDLSKSSVSYSSTYSLQTATTSSTTAFPSSSSSSNTTTPQKSQGVTSNVTGRLFIRKCRCLITCDSGSTCQSPNSILDPGISQLDALTIDAQKTWSLLSDYLSSSLEAGVQGEVEWLQRVKPDLCILDAPPFPALACKLANIPCVAVTNFTFDAILTSLKSSNLPSSISDPVSTPTILPLHHQEEIIRTFQSAYESCVGLLRLPGNIEMPAFTTNLGGLKGKGRFLIDTPLVVRPLLTPREVTRQFLGIPEGQKVLFVNFGGMPMSSSSLYTPQDVRIEDLLPEGWRILSLYPPPPSLEGHPRFQRIYPHSSYIPDIIHASDLILGKCGYGIVSEVLSTPHTPLLYIVRPNFAEEEGLINLLGERGVEMSGGDYRAWRWRGWIERGGRVSLELRGRFEVEFGEGERRSSGTVIQAPTSNLNSRKVIVPTITNSSSNGSGIGGGRNCDGANFVVDFLLSLIQTSLVTVVKEGGGGGVGRVGSVGVILPQEEEETAEEEEGVVGGVEEGVTSISLL